MANKIINDYPESTSPSGEWYVLVDDGTGCYVKVKLKNLPGGGVTPSTTTTSTTAPSSSSTSTSSTSSTTTTTSSSSSSTTTSSTSTITSSSTSTSTSTSSSTSSSSSTTTSTTTTEQLATVQIYSKYVNQQANGMSYSTDGINWTNLGITPNTTECAFFTTLSNLPIGNLYLKATLGVSTISICNASSFCTTCPGFTMSDLYGCPQVQVPIVGGTNIIYITVDGQNCL